MSLSEVKWRKTAGAAILLLSTCCMLSFPASATKQMPDYIIYNGLRTYLDLDWFFPSPLEVYFFDKPVYPFEANGTANYRGHFATWEVTNGQLYLNRVAYTDGGTSCMRNIPLEMVFRSPAPTDRVNATWFTGWLRIMSGDYGFDEYALVKVEDGRVTGQCQYAPKNGIGNCSHMEEEYDAYIGSFDGYSHNQWSEKDYAVLNPNTPTENEAQVRLKTLPGYQAALAVFTTQEARMFYAGCRPKSVEVFLEPKNDNRLRLSWNNSLVEDNTSANWNDLLKAYGKVHHVVKTLSPRGRASVRIYGDQLKGLDLRPEPNELFHEIEWWSDDGIEPEQFIREYQNAVAAISKHSWLQELLNSYPGYDISLSSLIDVEAWRRSGLRGDPAYRVVLNNDNWNQSFWIDFGKVDYRALITLSSGHQDAPIDHMLARIGAFFNLSTNTIAVVVEPSGRWHKRYYEPWRLWLCSIWSFATGFLLLHIAKKRHVSKYR